MNAGDRGGWIVTRTISGNVSRCTTPGAQLSACGEQSAAKPGWRDGEEETVRREDACPLEATAGRAEGRESGEG